MLNNDGTVSSNNYFGNTIQQSGTSENFVQDLVEQPDGKIIFLGSSNAPKVFRFNPNGTIDNTFQTNLGTGANKKVRKAVIDPTGKITLIGNFTSFNGAAVGGIVRLNADGTIDNTFKSSGTTSSTGIADIILTPDNKYILTGENINVFNGQSTYKKTVRLKYDGTIDLSFQAPQDGSFLRIGLLSDGRLIGVNKYVIYVLNANGSPTNIQTSISQSNGSSVLTGLHVQSNDKIILTGTFNKIATTSVNNIARIEINGTNFNVDNTFDIGTGPSHEIYCSQLTDNGKILIGGAFYLYDGISRDYIARLNNSGTPLFAENLTSTIGVNVFDSNFISFSPNPATNFIQLNSTEYTFYSIMSVDGKQIVKGPLEKGINKIDVGTLAGGVYFIDCFNKKSRFIKE